MSNFKSNIEKTAEQMIEKSSSFDIYSACWHREDAENCLSCRVERIRLRLVALILENTIKRG